ncbi:unnamed protein product [Cylindrotheca closterium]|uniref:Uncharacterized protein n=1 Tax=Cylindrotheca closterium TaxID=2856 RepID=A0AAD2G1C0_9STRA|nr:unnamed protein product [Cylindrotheca closterium]
MSLSPFRSEAPLGISILTKVLAQAVKSSPLTAPLPSSPPRATTAIANQPPPRDTTAAASWRELVTPDHTARTLSTSDHSNALDPGSGPGSSTPSLASSRVSDNPSDGSPSPVFPIFRHPQHSPPSDRTKGFHQGVSNEWSPREQFQHRMCDAPRAKKGQERTVAMELTHRGGLSSAQEAWTKEGAVAALDPTSAAPWRPFRFSRPRRQLERLLFANSRPVVVGRVGE